MTNRPMYNVEVEAHLSAVELVAGVDRVRCGVVEVHREVAIERLQDPFEVLLLHTRGQEEVDLIAHVQVVVEVQVAEADEAAHRPQRGGLTAGIEFRAPQSRSGRARDVGGRLTDHECG
jgi:hypothetical protein